MVIVKVKLFSTQAGSSPVEGLSTSVNYYVRKIDNNSFSLSEVGTGVTSKTLLHENDIVTDLKKSR